MTATEEGRQVRAVFANYRRVVQRGDETVTGMASKSRGATITDFAPGEEERLDSLGALVPKGYETDPAKMEEALLDAALKRALNSLDVTAEDFGQPPSVSAPPLGQPPRGTFTQGDTGVSPEDASPPEFSAGTPASTSDGTLVRSDAPDVEDTAALAEFIKSERLTAPETVALAEDDPERAQYVLDAERAAHGQDPRATVEKPLQKIIEQG